MAELTVGIIGASSLVGWRLMELMKGQRNILAFSRMPRDGQDGIRWLPVGATAGTPFPSGVEQWVCAAPIWVLTEYLPALAATGLRRIVVMSSTSRFAKAESRDAAERAVSSRISRAEEALGDWAAREGVEWFVLRPTMIYGYGRDQNVSRIARMAMRWRTVPVCGDAVGMRQPVHVDDVAWACLAALDAPQAHFALQLSGGETLSFYEMVRRIFVACNLPPRILRIPELAWRGAGAALSVVGRRNHLAAGLRMNTDQVFPHEEAVRMLGYQPRAFRLSAADIGR